ncbi:MAG: polysaccharide biosynthesis C-terminal domain-containing protein [Nanoarchaeota archaeon]|nr:polysaccharide biosynthesis C-terminal domain-containing protein [Nanoarchaeota archaeon]
MEHDYRSISRQLGVSYILNLLTYFLGPFLILLLTRNLTLEQFGVYSIFSATIAMFSVLLELGVSQYVITKLPSFEYSIKVFSFFSLLFFVIIFVIISLLIIIFSPLQNFFIGLLKVGKYVFEFKLTLIILGLESISRVVSSYLMALKKIELANFLSFLKPLLLISTLSIFILFYQLSLKLVLMLWIIVSATILAFYLFFIFGDFTFFYINHRRINLPLVRQALFFSIPLVPALACSWTIEFADRYILNFYSNPSNVGLYTLAFSLAAIVFSLSTIVSQVLYPHISESWGKKKNYVILFNAQLKYSLLILIPSLIGVFVMREQFITLIAGVNYLKSANVLVILLFFPFFASFISIFYQANLLNNKTFKIFLVYLSGAVINIILNILLIPKFFMYGAAFATITSYFVMFLLVLWLSKDMMIRWNMRFIRPFRILIAAIIMGVILHILNPQTYIFKIFCVFFGILIYISFLFILGVFIKDEKMLITKIIDEFKKLFK